MGAAPTLFASRASKASFQARRSSCQTPRPIKPASARRPNTVTPSNRACRSRCHMAPISAGREARLLSPVLVLEGNQRRLEHAQHDEGQERGEQTPEHNVDPDGRSQLKFDKERAAQHQTAKNENGKHGRAIAGVGKGKAEAAAPAALAQAETRAKQGTLATARAAAFEAAHKRGCHVGHAEFASLNLGWRLRGDPPGPPLGLWSAKADGRTASGPAACRRPRHRCTRTRRARPRRRSANTRRQPQSQSAVWGKNARPWRETGTRSETSCQLRRGRRGSPWP